MENVDQRVRQVAPGVGPCAGGCVCFLSHTSSFTQCSVLLWWVRQGCSENVKGLLNTVYKRWRPPHKDIEYGGDITEAMGSGSRVGPFQESRDPEMGRRRPWGQGRGSLGPIKWAAWPEARAIAVRWLILGSMLFEKEGRQAASGLTRHLPPQTGTFVLVLEQQMPTR